MYVVIWDTVFKFRLRDIDLEMHNTVAVQS